MGPEGSVVACPLLPWPLRAPLRGCGCPHAACACWPHTAPSVERCVADASWLSRPQAKAAAGTLKSLTLDQLKMWLRSRGLTVGGKKDELIARIQNKLGA